jgi:hypothetical protein
VCHRLTVLHQCARSGKAARAPGRTMLRENEVREEEVGASPVIAESAERPPPPLYSIQASNFGASSVVGEGSLPLPPSPSPLPSPALRTSSMTSTTTTKAPQLAQSDLQAALRTRLIESGEFSK